MGADAWGILSARLKGFTSFSDWTSWQDNAVRDNYLQDLEDIPDPVILRMADGVLKRFAQRPSVKDLRDWAASLAPPPPFRIPDARRLSGPEAQVGVPCPESIRAELTAFFAAHPTKRPAEGRCGLIFRQVATGLVAVTADGMTPDAAQEAAWTRNERWPHQETTVYRRGDPLPVRSALAAGAEAVGWGNRRPQTPPAKEVSP